ncbi:MAG: cyclase family protein [bacterium]
MTTIIDLTHKFTKIMPVCRFDEPASIKKIKNLKKDKYNDWQLVTGMHVGTHIDGPGHLTNSKILLSDFSVDKFIGNGFLIDARNKKIDESLLKKMPNKKDLIVLILTGFDKKFGSQEYFENHPILSPCFAQKLIEQKIKMIGIDFFSPDKYPFEIHKMFFKNNILIIENLTNLEKLLDVKNFKVFALPLKTETDSALARVVAIGN